MRTLRLKLIGILILAVTLPAVPAAWTVHALFRLTLDPLLEAGIGDGLRAGLMVSRDALEAEKERFRADLVRGAPVDTLGLSALAVLDARERSALDAWARAARDGEPLAGGAALLIGPERIPLGGVELLVARVSRIAGSPVWVARPLPRELAARAAQLTETMQLVETLRRERGAVVRSLVATFLVVYLAILAVVLVLGLYLAHRLIRPLARLGGAIDRVAAGDLEARVPLAEAGEVRGLVEHFNTMAARLGEQQTELVRLEKLAAWRQMSRRLAHEIKNPLTPIQLAAQEMRDSFGGVAGDDARRQLVVEATAIIEEEVERLRALVVEFSQFARMPDPQMAWVDVDELLGDLAALYGNARLEVADVRRNGGAQGRLWCDRDQMRRALVNLIDNAIAAQTGTGGESPVRVEVDAAAGATVLSVLDRGPGVPPADRQRIFEPDVTSKSDGMGLGLAIVRSTVDGHGGTIEVSERDGGGARFTLALPNGGSQG